MNPVQFSGWRLGIKLLSFGVLGLVAMAGAHAVSLSSTSTSPSTPSAALLEQPLTASAIAEKALGQYAVRTWNTRNGLPHNSVNKIAQAKDGSIWLATWEGPVRYNGQTFQIYADTAETKMPEAGALDVSMSPNQQLIQVAGTRGAVVRFDGQRWDYVKVGDGYIFETLIDQQQHFWAASTAGVYQVDSSGQGQHKLYTQTEGLPADFTFRIHQASRSYRENAGVWAGTRLGLAYYHAATDSFVQEPSVPATQVRAMLTLANGTLVVATDEGVFFQRALGESFQPWPVPIKDRVTSLVEGPNGCLWVGTFTQGLGRFCLNSEQWLSVEDGLPNSHINDLFKDRDNNLWIASHGGLVQLRNTLFSSYTQTDGIKGNNVRAIAEDAQGAIWIGTNDGISRQQGDRFVAVAGQSDTNKVSVLSLARGSEQLMYVGSYTSGLLQLSQQGLSASLTAANGLDSNEVRIVKVLPSGHLLLGTPEGLKLVAAEFGKLTVLDSLNSANGLPGDFISSITIDPNGGIWLGSTLTLMYLRPQVADPLAQLTTTPSFNLWQPEAVDLPAFTGARNVFAGVVHQQRLWFATDHGLITRPLASDDWRWLSRRDGLPFDKAFSINFDSNHHLWLGSSQGIARLSRQTLDGWLNRRITNISYQRFSEADGMVTRQLTTGGPASLVSDSNQLWFASALGVIAVNPAQAQANDAEDNKPEPVLLEAINADKQLLLAPQYDAAQSVDDLQLTPTTKRITFSYVSMTYAMPEQLEYQTRLVGFDDDWINRGSATAVEYTSLPPGNYRFEVRARYLGGQWNEPTGIKFSQQGRFFDQRNVWYALVVLALLLGGLLGWRLTSKR
ncbi:hypothetical protein NOG12_00660 [Pseudidiomarina sp. GXY010]|uniref:Two component regulator three Y domain-containing protein n=1 Tax=Pseudidiomarina fusca TaxID=2965078 RepID=A0ABU3KSY5_9GAMM|nr:two-component regulator propeller domain-containing protein [Pseudidiomarina sp. GXY010]MDT7524609.1 hypothetical protein [Pseudidiomarina sp. GXY010]